MQQTRQWEKEPRSSSAIRAQAETSKNTAHAPECMLKLTPRPGGYFNARLERLAGHQAPHILLLHELPGLLPTTTPNAASIYSLGTRNLFQNLLCFTSPCSSLSIANVNSFKITYIFLLQAHCMKEPRQPEDGGHVFFI